MSIQLRVYQTYQNHWSVSAKESVKLYNSDYQSVILELDRVDEMPPKRTSSVTRVSKHKTSVKNKSQQNVKDVGDKTTKPKSKRVQKRQPAKVMKQTTIRSRMKKMLAAGKGKSTTASQRCRHLD